MSKIPFDIKFRPQIESGEYKVETQFGGPVEIVCWNRRDDTANKTIVGIIREGTVEEIASWNIDGKLCDAAFPQNSAYDLFLVTLEPELTDFEKAIETICTNLVSDIDKVDNVKQIAAKLLYLAKKEICKSCLIGIDEYWRGRKEATEEASKGYHYEGPYMPTYNYCPHGGECTNPFHDCISCPRKSTIDINTTTGTLTAKVEG